MPRWGGHARPDLPADSVRCGDRISVPIRFVCERLFMTKLGDDEHIKLRGGPRDGEQLSNVGAAGLVDVLSVPTLDGPNCRYRKTKGYSQLRGAQGAEPYARI